MPTFSQIALIILQDIGKRGFTTSTTHYIANADNKAIRMPGMRIELISSLSLVYFIQLTGWSHQVAEPGFLH